MISDSSYGYIVLENYQSTECQACKPMCSKCHEILASPGHQTCTCFTCPECGRRNTEIMYHTCGKQPGFYANNNIIYLPESCLGEKYSYTYRNLVRYLRGKIILEFGAEVGSTASYFLRHGAERVISVEGNRGWYDRLVENAEQMDDRCTPIHLHLNNSADLEKLIKKYKPDILHMDIEGDEKYLLELSNELWSTIPIIDLEVHRDKKMLSEFVERLFDLCYEINLYVLDPEHGGWVLTAVKMDPKNFLDCKGYAI